MSRTSRQPTRRELLKAGSALAGVGALTLAGCRDVSRVGRRRDRGRVVVVGGGLAGLAAARTLSEDRWHVTVLEARERVGGRVLTAELPDGQHGELGGEFIDRDHSAMRTLVSELGLALERIPWDGGEDVVWQGGVREGWAEYLDADGGVARRDRDRFYTALARLARGVDPDDPAAAPNAEAIDRSSVADFLDDLALSARGRFFVERVDILDEYTVAADRLSLLQVVGDTARTIALRNRDYEAFRVEGGNGQVADRMADELEDAVELGSAATAIIQEGDRVRVQAGSQIVTGDYAVVATPLPPLRRVRFEPALPPAMATAVARLGYGTGTKTLLSYTDRVWRDEGFTGYAVTDLPIGSTWEATDAQRGPGGILLGYTVGPPGTTFGAEPAPRRVDVMTADVERLYPGSAGARRRGVSIVWQAERFTGGTYTAYRPGQVTEFWHAIREPFQRIHWAGEQTDVYTGYMEGAVRSGQRAAREIIARA